MKALILLFALFFASRISASETPFENTFYIRAGLAFDVVQMSTDRIIDHHEQDADGEEDEVRTFGYGFSTSIAYRWTSWEAVMGSDVLFGNVNDITFKDGNNSIRGEGFFRLISLGPQIRYFTPYTIFNRATVYVGGGPSWSLQTYVFNNASSTGNFSDKNRISFENIGGGIFIGLQEITPFKENHPMFFEVGYNYMHSYKVSLLDASNKTDVITLSEGNSNDFSAHYFVFRMGMTLF